ncbi:hypothetical protein M5W83_15315 [Paenibacillus thiaminolyticus]|uniref:YwoF protein n=1 Tax=Paenibacillus thiaminolyticus TaxID=49283 RepID=A0AAP9DW94_PANTH|nr:hypothetical protein [Paenibacillus thiaminolyticus]MCY9534548.1 hypothetical protein [Paenibacillus thiaminolyticus]MCY9600150.1 hypothetical protein [Paenibacillus thiaminolyticus]MCY9608516.1 hypothetical protein [Paenibacillus thiaminolyticus]MCY9615192.1 hypothetical protein [Paenibacillus thiaminolyticus]MCY9620600.1 hypothetical protein [Paenibacillus thiaminolyticus]
MALVVGSLMGSTSAAPACAAGTVLCVPGREQQQCRDECEHAMEDAAACGMRRIPHPTGEYCACDGGFYHQKLQINRSGSAVAGPITFQSDASDTAVIDGNGTGLSATNVEVGETAAGRAAEEGETVNPAYVQEFTRF